MKHSPGFLKISESARERVKEVEPEAVLESLKNKENFFFVDVREESEWAAGHLPGAIHLSKGIIERDIETRIPDPNTRIVLYCGGGYRSALAARNLSEMGYKNVESMNGGFRGWSEKKLPDSV
ncbi:MAG: sulfurtransferase [Proteobacteria bacterium]|nr:MAG: sulfurtransferase [Pseudomonadota bacterium]